MEHPRDLVIKVKYGESIKRLTSSVFGNNLDVDIAKLREKIILTFNLSPSAEFILTYSDVDGDTIMLDDDEDLRDAAINQRLNPLRINVQLRSLPNAAPAAEPRPNAANPTRRGPLDDLSLLSSSLEEVLRSPPHDVLKTLSTVTEKIGKNAPPIVKELLTKLSTLEIPQAARPSNVPSESSSSPASATEEATPIASSNAAKSAPASKKGKEPKVIPVFDMGTTSELPTENQAEDNTYADKKPASERPCKGKAAMQNPLHRAPFCAPHMRHASHYNAFLKDQLVRPPLGPSPSMCGPHHHPFPVPSFPPFNGKLAPPPPPSNGNLARPVYDFPVGEPFSGHLNGNVDAPASDVPPYPSTFFPVGHSYKKTDEHESIFPACHRGIVCDGCDTTPIVGPRYKSIVNHDYDLCGKCFARFGKQDEYTKISVPSPSRMSWDLNAPSNFCPRPPFSAPVFPAWGSKMRSKLESRFIQDVTIPDGTIMAPLTPFTKIWRMRNNGSLLWPFGSQLVWVGGDQLTSRLSVQLEIPLNGLPSGEEIDIAVDFSAPARAGRYLSYWRLASPSGQKFGQRVWVLFQVEQPNSSKQEIKYTTVSNLVPESSNCNSRDAETSDVQDTSEPSVKNTTSNDRPILDGTQTAVTEPETNTTNGPNTHTSPTVSYPLIDLSPTPEVVADPIPSVPILEGTDTNEDILLKELEEMGFKQVDLNKEVLRLNKYDLEQSVQDLCGFSEWDPLLEELRGMGFDDKEKNKKLLVKNGGSIKRVVMDLVTGEKTE